MSDIKYAIRYFTREGSTKKLAEAIGDEINVEAFDINEPIIDKVDVLFLGGAVYKSDLDLEMKSFIKTLEKDLVGQVVVFSISSGSKMPYDVMKQYLDEIGIPVYNDSYFCKGKKLFMNAGHPDIDDLKACRIFARKVVNELENK